MEDNSFYSFIDSNIIRLLLDGPNKKLSEGKLKKVIIPICRRKPELFEKIIKYVTNNISKNIEILDDFYTSEDKKNYDEGKYIAQMISATEKVDNKSFKGTTYTIYYL